MPMKKSGLFRNKNAKATPYKNKGVTEVGKEAKTHSYKEYVQKMFGGGMMSPQPFTAQKPTGAARTDPPRPMPPRRPIPGSTGTLGDRALNFGKPRTQLIDPILPRGKVGKGPGMKAGGKTKKWVRVECLDQDQLNLKILVRLEVGGIK